MKYFYVIADVNKKTTLFWLRDSRTKSRIPQLLHNSPGLKHDPVKVLIFGIVGFGIIQSRDKVKKMF